MTITGEEANAEEDQIPVGSGGSPIALESVVVRYDQRPDRRTVYPPGLSGVARMSTWLSADAGAFVDLDSAR